MGIFKKKQTDESVSYMNRRRHILNDKSSFAVQEAYKTLRTNVHFYLRGEGCRKFCITSGSAGEGKSITILNLAISFAQTGKKVLLMDADMRRPILSRLLVEKASPGLSNVLAGLATDTEAIRKRAYPNLDVMLSGEIPPNPSELLQSDEMGALIARLSEKYDYILVDTPPVGVVSDTCIIAGLLDGVLFLVRQNYSERDIIRRSLKQMELAGTNVMGFVLNGLDVNTKRGYKRGYYKYKGKDGSYAYRPNRKEDGNEEKR